MGKPVKLRQGHGADGPEPNAAAISAVAWRPGRDLDLAEWVHQGKRLGSIGRGSAWWVGDWVNYGNGKFGEKYVRAAHVTGYDVQTLMNMAYVASRFNVSRRRETLSWSHHAEVAGLPSEQRDGWLQFAEAGSVSVRGLREELRRWRAQTKRELVDSGAYNRADNHPGNRADDGVDQGVDQNVDETERGAQSTDEGSSGGVYDDPSRCPRCGCAVHPASAAVMGQDGRSR